LQAMKTINGRHIKILIFIVLWLIDLCIRVKYTDLNYILKLMYNSAPQ
jgi:hypothetical protein